MNPLNILLIDVKDRLGQRIESLPFPVGLNCVYARHDDNLGQLVTHVNPAVIVYFTSLISTRESLKPVKVMLKRNVSIPIVFITRHSTESRAIAAIKAGVDDYFKVPFSEKALLKSIRRYLKSIYADSDMKHTDALSPDLTGHKLVGETPPMRDLKAYLPRVAFADCSVLITGETGTGKELVVESIHALSPRKKEPLVRINCAALPDSLVESELFGYDRGAFTGAEAAKKGKFESAGNGSVFLDEIGDMSPYAQAKILRSIESKEICRLGGNTHIPLNFRIIAATNRDPEGMIYSDQFRSDLYYRLDIARVHLPPLRDRKEDIPLLAEYGITKLNRRYNRHVKGLSANAALMLKRYNWPGNVRELMNVLEAAYINQPGRKVRYRNLPQQFKMRFEASGRLPNDERRFIVSTLLESNWNKSFAAQKLKWSRMTLYRKMAKYNIVENRSPKR